MPKQLVTIKILVINIKTFECRLVPESIQWLVVKGRQEEAEAILQKAAAFNGISVQGKILVASDSEQDKNDKKLFATSEAKEMKDVLTKNVIIDNTGILTDVLTSNTS